MRGALLLVAALACAASGLAAERWPAERAPAYRVLAADVTDATVAGDTTVTGLAFGVAANSKYAAHCYLVVSADAATTGVQLGLSGPAAPTAVTIVFKSFLATNSLASVGVNAFGSHGTTSSGGTTRTINEIHMLLDNGANAGTVQVVVNTEVDLAQVVVYAGSWCEWTGF